MPPIMRWYIIDLSPAPGLLMDMKGMLLPIGVALLTATWPLLKLLVGEGRRVRVVADRVSCMVVPSLLQSEAGISQRNITVENVGRTCLSSRIRPSFPTS